ncbi:condensation domain-containing protein, partial [Rhodococcus sp. NPDC003322]
MANPFDDGGSVMYRTGDLARWRADGQLEYLGRTDFQVKLRGQRIELGEIESALERVDGVSQAVVVLDSRGSTGDRLVGYVVPAVGVDLAGGDLRTAVSDALPAYMVPSTVMVLEEFPLNTSGKLDRKKLPAPVFEARAFRAPTTPIEQTVADVFVEVLGAGQVGLDDDFFELGGNSLIAMRVVSMLSARVDGRVSVRDLFDASTVAGLAARVERARGAGSREALVAMPRSERPVPLSLAQQRMWFLNQFDPASAAYNIPIALRLRGRLDLEVLGAAVGDLVARHEVLRTVYPDTEDGPVQVILSADQSVPDLTPVPLAAEDVLAVVGEFLSDGFDVTEAVPLRVRLYRVGEDEHVLVIAIHHISGDGYSVAPLTRDLMTAYLARTAGSAPQWAPLSIQYADYALWQRRVLGSESDPDSLIHQQLEYWKSALAGLPDQLDLPTDRPRPAVQSYHGGKVSVEIGADLHRALDELARHRSATVFMAVHAAFAVLLARLSGTEDIAVGTPFAGRDEAAVEDLIGMFVNTLVFRTQVDPSMPFTDLLGQVRETDLGAFGNADVPFERLVEVLNPTRSTARHPLCQVGFSFHNMAVSEFALPDLEIAPVEFDVEVSQFDLHLMVTDLRSADGELEGLSTVLTYATALFDEQTAQAIVDRFVRVLEAVVADPQVVVGDIELLDDVESGRLLGEWNSTGESVSDVSLVELFDAQVARTPDAPALVFEGETVSYA